jgi:DNA-binding NtrC family response regulator
MDWLSSGSIAERLINRVEKTFSNQVMTIQVLILEKSKLTRDALVQMVYLCGCEAVSVQNPDWALGALTGVKFDFLIAGIAPGDDSVPRLAYAAREQQPSLYIILGTSHINETATSQIADAYVPFPLSVHELRQTMQQLLSKASET